MEDEHFSNVFRQEPYDRTILTEGWQGGVEPRQNDTTELFCTLRRRREGLDERMNQ